MSGPYHGSRRSRVDAAVGTHQGCSSIPEPTQQIRSGTEAMLGGDTVGKVVAPRSQELGVSPELIGIDQGLEGRLVEIGQMAHVVAETPPGGGRGQPPLRGSELVEDPMQSSRLGDEVVDEGRQFGAHQRSVQKATSVPERRAFSADHDAHVMVA